MGLELHEVIDLDYCACCGLECGYDGKITCDRCDDHYGQITCPFNWISWRWA